MFCRTLQYTAQSGQIPNLTSQALYHSKILSPDKRSSLFSAAVVTQKKVFVALMRHLESFFEFFFNFLHFTSSFGNPLGNAHLVAIFQNFFFNRH
jgi:hypothetical protein